jgi:hypothetical protein
VSAFAERVGAHVRVWALQVLRVTRPRSHFQQGHQFGIRGQRLSREGGDLVERGDFRLDRIHPAAGRLQAQTGARDRPSLRRDLISSIRAAEPVGALEHASVSPRVPRGLRHALPALKQLQHASQIECLCGLRHRSPELPVEVPGLLWEQDATD